MAYHTLSAFLWPWISLFAILLAMLLYFGLLLLYFTLHPWKTVLGLRRLGESVWSDGWSGVFSHLSAFFNDIGFWPEVCHHLVVSVLGY